MSCGCSSKVNCTCNQCTSCPTVCVELLVSNSWNVPACGSSAILAVDGLTSVLVGAYVFNPTYGYFRITGFNSLNGQITVINECIEGNATPGTTVSADTTFIFSGPPSTAAVSIIDSFVMPACSGSVVVEVSGRPSVVIGAYIYTPDVGWLEITAYDESTNLMTLKNNCTTGNVAAGSAVVAGSTFIFVAPPFNVEFIYNGGTSGGAVNAQTLTFVGTPTAYFTGMTILWKAGLTSTAASPTINVNGFGPIVMVDETLTGLPPGVIVTNTQYTMTYNGTNFVITSPTSSLQVSYTPTITTNGGGPISSTVIDNANWTFNFGSRTILLTLLFSTDMTLAVAPTIVSASIPFTSNDYVIKAGYVNDNANGTGIITVAPAGTVVTFTKDVAGSVYNASAVRVFGVQITFKVT